MMNVKTSGLMFTLLTSAVVALQFHDARISGTCPRPGGWCTHDTTYEEKDCDGDGIADPTCDDGLGNFGVISSKNSCSDSWPNGNCITPGPKPAPIPLTIFNTDELGLAQDSHLLGGPLDLD